MFKNVSIVNLKVQLNLVKMVAIINPKLYNNDSSPNFIHGSVFIVLQVTEGRL